MGLLDGIKWVYKIFPPVPPAPDQRGDKFVERYVGNILAVDEPAVHVARLFGEKGYRTEKEDAANLQSAIIPIPIPKSGLASRVRNYFSK